MTPVVICIADSQAERSRLAGMFDGAGVLVMAADADSARSFLGDLTAPAASSAGLEVDLAGHHASWRGAALALTRRELVVLDCLAGRPGQVWTYEQLYARGWSEVFFPGPAAVQAVVKRLRAKLRSAGVTSEVESVRGVGFRLTAPRPVTLGLVAS